MISRGRGRGGLEGFDSVFNKREIGKSNLQLDIGKNEEVGIVTMKKRREGNRRSIGRHVGYVLSRSASCKSLEVAASLQVALWLRLGVLLLA